MAISTAFCAVLACTTIASLVDATALDDYVNKPDSHYRYSDLGNPYHGDGYTTYFLNMTSQKWLNDSVSSRSVWWHYLVVTVPDKVEYPEHSLLYITAGSNTDAIPTTDDKDVAMSLLMAVSTGSVVGALFQVPNQPIHFPEDPLHKKSRSENDILAFTWWHFMYHTNEPEYIAWLPMAKAAKRGLDTVADFAAKLKPGVLKIDKFVVTGASKRGWTTWLLGAVDKRVVGIAPIVTDLFNMYPNLQHYWRSFGDWPFAFDSFWQLNLTELLDSPKFPLFEEIVDVVSYKDRLTMPKMQTTTAGDEMFILDNSFFYWDLLSGTKFLRTIPNAEHSCVGHFSSLLLNVRAFYSRILANKPYPEVYWNITRTADGGSILFHTETAPSNIKMWHTTTLDGKMRDFRLFTAAIPSKKVFHPVFWFEGDIEQVDDKTYHSSMPVPSEGWTGFFIQATYSGPLNSSLEITTQVNIVPDTYPFPVCHGLGCKGKLV